VHTFVNPFDDFDIIIALLLLILVFIFYRKEFLDVLEGDLSVDSSAHDDDVSSSSSSSSPGRANINSISLQ
jgi:hypothetical protein